MKKPWEWDEGDLLALVGSKEEIDLEFKQSAALSPFGGREKGELSKDVSAMANSAGGTLVYGIKEDGMVATELDEGLDPTVVTKERIEQVIATIQRKIDGVRIKQVELPSRPGRVAYVISVPQSRRAPHQAQDKRFYKRANFQSVPMEEYEIRDVARREDTPEIHGRLEFEHGGGGPPGPAWLLTAKVFVINASPAPATMFTVQLLVDERIAIGPTTEWLHGERRVVKADRRPRILQTLNYHWVSPPGPPLFAELEQVRVGNAMLQIPSTHDHECILGCRIVAPRYVRTRFRVVTCRRDGHPIYGREDLTEEDLARYDLV